ncbi:hypothetical protein [Enterococcus sp. SMC-9]|uniref:hypothetical protein n=1 Tax=Enterococcus sp. SMC-9 TaxID=2862343 RepID=UPI001E4EED33|nr:hypothetical protein [Enterococcus sp. SMC-9]MCD1023505.1 hypothetical protein [Enterococcus sp. SMC-9]
MKFLTRINDNLTAMIVILIFCILFAGFAFMGSINIWVTWIVIFIFAIVAISFCLGAYVQELELKKD